MIQFGDIYRGRSVLVTGHTGFKGSWLCLWLTAIGARVTGYSLKAPTEPNHFDLLKLKINSVIGDIRDSGKLASVFISSKPEIVFHMAAQSLVRRSYENPVETYQTNVMGTLNVFEACRIAPTLRAIVNITSDKCYENRECRRGYKEECPMGGWDPYSSSKGCAEILTASYRKSYFNPEHYGKIHKVLLASVRAGNVIGGGDWADDRLIPDIIKAASQNRFVIIRNPDSIRPWQHVLEPLSGYLMLGQKLLESRKEFAQAWNFGNSGRDELTVRDIVERISAGWDKVRYKIKRDKSEPHEAAMLKLDCSKAFKLLKWKGIWNTDKALSITIEWYRNYYEKHRVNSTSDMASYLKESLRRKAAWIRSN